MNELVFITAVEEEMEKEKEKEEEEEEEEKQQRHLTMCLCRVRRHTIFPLKSTSHITDIYHTSNTRKHCCC